VLLLTALHDAGCVAGDRIEHAALVPAELVGDLAHWGVRVVTQPGFLTHRGDDYLRDLRATDGTSSLLGLPHTARSEKAGAWAAKSTPLPSRLGSTFIRSDPPGSRSPRILGARNATWHARTSDLLTGNDWAATIQEWINPTRLPCEPDSSVRSPSGTRKA